MPTTERSPSYIPQAEALLGTHAFYDEEREQALHKKEGGLTFTAESAGMRGLLYVRALRLMAQAVAEESYEHRRHALRPSRLGKFALEHLPEVLDIARQLAVINTAERTLAEREEIFLGGLRSHQEPYMRDIIDFMNELPAKITVDLDGAPQEVRLRGALVEAPTGLGKTVLMARALVALGVGQPIENIEHDQERVRAIIIVPSQTIAEQMTGKVGDDTLRRFAPNVTVGAHYQHEKTLDTDVLVVTIEQFIEHFKDGAFRGQRFDACIVDEAHTVTQPLLQRALLEHWRGGPVIGFTATPEYSPKKDARNILSRRIFYGELLDFIENKEERLLNAAQIFEIRADHDHYLNQELMDTYEGMSEKDIDQMVTREATAEFLTTMIEQGRRGMVFCEQGGREPSGYAKLMAARLKDLKKPDGSPLRVAVAGSINNGKSPDDPDSNAGIRRRYAAGELDFITTVDWGREGLNEDIDVVVTAGKITSRHKFLQEVGRGTRLSTRFPITTYAHIYTPAHDLKALSLFGLFGFEEIEQGAIIGRKDTGDQNPDDTSPGDQLPRGATPVADFPLRIQRLLATVNTKTVGEALFHREAYTPVPKGYKPFPDIMHDVPGPPVTIRKYLRDERGFACIGRYESHEGKRVFVFYFEPAAETYLNTFRGAVARVDLQREFGGVDVNIVDAMADEAGVKSFTWFYYNGARIPHYSEKDANSMRKIFKKTPQAKPTDYSRRRLAAAAGVKENTLMTRLTATEKAQIVRKRTTTASGKIRVLDHWDEAAGKAIVERIKEALETGGIPLYLLSQELAVRHVKAQKKPLADFADRIGEPTEIVRVAREGRPPRCITWNALRQAEEHFGVRHNSFTIVYSRLPRDRTDRDADKLRYAEEIIAKLSALA